MALILASITLATVALGQAINQYGVGLIAFYGDTGLDRDKIRAALPFREGDTIAGDKLAEMLQRSAESVKRVTGHAPTDIAPVCCDVHGKWIFYVGLGGSNSRRLPYNRTPRGKARLPADISDLYRQMGETLMKALQQGNVDEDDSQGYALSKYPPLHELQLKMRAVALQQEESILQVLAFSSDAAQRQAAAMALGYARRSRKQIDALVRASRDSDDIVRNNATRALVVLARSAPDTARLIPATNFIAMLNSGIWMDRNKAGFLLLTLSAGREPSLLKRLRAEALPSLIEMARWDADHAFGARMMLGRIARIPDSRTQELIAAGKIDEIIQAAEKG